MHSIQLQNKSFNRKIRKTLLVISLMSIFAMAFYCQQSFKSERERLLAQLAIQAEFTAASTQAFFDDIGNSLELAARILKNKDDLATHFELLKQILRQHPEIAIISTFDASGNRLATVRNSPAGSIAPGKNRMSQFPRQYANSFTQVMADIGSSTHYAVGQVEYGNITQEWVIPFHYAFRRADGHIDYIISASIPVSRQTSLWNNLKLPPDTRIGLYRDDGLIEARWPEVGFSEETLYGDKKLPQSPLEDVVKDREARGFYEGYNSANRDTRLGAYTRLPHLPLTAFASVPTSLVYLNWWHHNYALVIALFICMALSAIAILILLREEKDFSAILVAQAYTDGLTGLLNRKAAEEYLEQKVKLAAARPATFAVMFIDLDHFKSINDTLGHDYGDFVLKQAAIRLKSAIRGDDMLARLGGDEFLAVIDCDSEEQARGAANRLLAAVQEPFLVDGQPMYLSMSIGISLYPLHGVTVKDLLKQADAAMYNIKNAKRNGFAFSSGAEVNQASPDTTAEQV